MPRFALCLIAALAVTAPAAAQSIGEPIPGQGEKPAKTRLPSAKANTAARPCPEYGAGFVKVEGSSLCVRAGGQVRAEFGKSSSNRYGGSSFGSAAQGRGYVEARGNTGLGQVRAVISGGGRVGDLDRDRYGGGFYR